MHGYNCCAASSLFRLFLPLPSLATCSYLLWGVGVPLSFAILTIYYRRLSMHNLPPAELVVSSFLPLGAWVGCLVNQPSELVAAADSGQGM